MAQEKIQMPSSGAGITRYFEDYTSKLSFPPELVVVFAFFIILAVVVLKLYVGGLLGI